MCGCLIIGDEVRYELNMKLFAGYDILEITEEDLKRDTSRDLDALVRLMNKMDAEELERQVYEEFHFDICVRCRELFRNDPLGRSRRSAASCSEGDGK
jgi:hypothetical protein